MLSQIIFLDSDNVALADVGQLFNTPQYARYGAILWPDYWESSAAPDLLKILGLKETPLGTTESGQMVFDKARWGQKPLLGEGQCCWAPAVIWPFLCSMDSNLCQVLAF